MSEQDHDLDTLVDIVEAVAANEPYYPNPDGGHMLCVFCDSEVSEELLDEYGQHHETCPYRRAADYLNLSRQELHYQGTFPMTFLNDGESVRRGSDPGHIIIAKVVDGITHQTHINIGQIAKRKPDGRIEVTDE